MGSDLEQVDTDISSIDFFTQQPGASKFIEE